MDPQQFQFNNPISGIGVASITIPIHKGGHRALKERTIPDEIALYITDNEAYIWGGPIIKRSRRPDGVTVKIDANHWKSWLYERAMMQQIVHTNYDQYQMAYDLIDFAVSAAGAPVIVHGSTLSGNTRDFTVQPTWSVGEALDSFAKRDGGYDWDLQIQHNSTTGYPELSFVMFAQGGSRNARPVLILDHSASRNSVNIGDIVEDATERVTKAWAIGDGQWPDAEYVSDSDPRLTAGHTLLREGVTTYSGVTQKTTLFDHAHARRIQQDQNSSLIPVEHDYEMFPLNVYSPGDRARLIIKNDWDDMDISGIRITDRAVKMTGPESKILVTDVLDLGDVRN